MTITDFNYDSSYLPGLTCNMDVRTHIGRSTPLYWHLVVRNGNFTFLLLEFILADQLADLPPKYWHLVVKNDNFTSLLLRVHIDRSTGRSTPHYWHLVVQNSNFTFLLLEFILADQPPPQVLAPIGQEWQFYISTVRVHIGRSHGRSTPDLTP